MELGLPPPKGGRGVLSVKPVVTAAAGGFSTSAKNLIVSYKRLCKIVNLLRRTVMVRIGQIAQPPKVQLIVVCHSGF